MNRVLTTLALGAAVLFGAAVLWSLPSASYAVRAIAAADDPVALSDLALTHAFDAPRAEREISEALTAGDTDLALSLVDLAQERGVAVAPELIDEVRTAATPSTVEAVRKVARGFVTGEPDDGYSLTGTLLGDLFVFGDVRDAVRESAHAAQGKPVDTTILALAAAGIAITAGTYATVGAAAPARAGLSLAKVASRTGRIGSKLTRALRIEKTQNLVHLARDVGRVQSKAGTRAALDGLRVVDTPKDATRLARLADAKGGKTRAIVKVLGRGAIVLTTALWDLAGWIFWAIASLIGFAATLKRAVERMTLNALRRRRHRAAMRAAALAGAGLSR